MALDIKTKKTINLILSDNWVKNIENATSCNFSENPAFDSDLVISYERNFNKVYAEITDGLVKKAEISFKEFTQEEKDKVVEILRKNPVIAIEINMGTFPEYFVDFLQGQGLNILPTKDEDFSYSCCCAEGCICNHIASLISFIADEIYTNPITLFELRGIDYKEIQNIAKEIDIYRHDNLDIENYILDIRHASKSNIYDKVFQKSKVFNIKPLNIDEVFAFLPDRPEHFPKSDFKDYLKEIYETIIEESSSIFTPKNISPVRNTDFHFFYDKDKELKAFVTPANNFEYYLKNKGSLMRYQTEKLFLPVYNNKEEIIEYKETEGIILNKEIVFEYILNFSNVIDNDYLSDSFKFFNFLSCFAIELVKTGAFLPQVNYNDDRFFTISYIPYSNTEDINEIIKYCKSIMPLNFAFINEAEKIFSNGFIKIILSNLITHIIYKTAFLKASKFKNSAVANIFIKNKPTNSYTKDNKNIARSINLWLQGLFIKNNRFSPILRINIEPNEELTLHIDVANYKKPGEFVALKNIFSEKEVFGEPTDKIKLQISNQLLFASYYMPELKEILLSQGDFIPVINLKDLLLIISHTYEILSTLGINIAIPKELKQIVTPSITLSAKMKTDSIDDINFSDLKNSSAFSINDIMEFSYEIALGDEKISQEEFLKLVSATDGIVKYKDKYLMLRPNEVNSIIQKLEKPVEQNINALSLLHSAFSGELNGVQFQFDEMMRKVLDEFVKIEEVQIPEGLNGTLRDYQAKGYKWLYSNAVKGFGSCIADDMGLGKTIQVISLLLKFKEMNRIKKPALVICPTTLVGNWQKEFEKFAPSLKFNIYHGTERELNLDCDVIITTYGLLRIDIDKFLETEWALAIIDEAQNIKNPNTAQTLAVKSLNAKNFIAMTGTPVENRLTELWSIFDYINKGYLGSIRDFQHNYAYPIERNKEFNKIEKLKLATSPFILRRLKTDKHIIDDLPEKIVMDEYCYLTKNQAALYEKTLQNSMQTIQSTSGINRRGNILKLITSLKQICNHPRHYQKTGDGKAELSGKAAKTLSIIERVLEADEKILLFTQYKEMGDILVSMISSELKVTPLFFHGTLSRLRREEIIEEFQNNPESPVMVVSLKAGGTGLNLTAATNVIHYDLWWNPAVEDQATDRTYRIGQTKNVMVHRLITIGTFEEKIDEMIKSKKHLADTTLYTGEKMITELTNNELMEIFSLND